MLPYPLMSLCLFFKNYPLPQIAGLGAGGHTTVIGENLTRRLLRRAVQIVHQPSKVLRLDKAAGDVWRDTVSFLITLADSAFFYNVLFYQIGTS